jgi:DNA-binding transcriptional ArsR family regulator
LGLDPDAYPPHGNGSLIVNNSYMGLTINDPASRPHAQRFSEMGPPEPRRYVIGGLVPEAHTTVIYGDGGVAKSMLMLSASLTVANGGHSWLGYPVQGGPVLYLDFELDDQEQNRRVKQLAQAEGLSGPPDSLLYMGALGYKARTAFEAALESCKEHGVKLMILDSLGPALQGDAEAARDVIGFYQNVLEPFRAQGITVVIVDHQSKLQAGQRYQSKRAFGSVFKGNLARSVIQVEARDRWENKLSLLLRQVKHNFGPLADPFGVELTFAEEMVTVEHAELEASAMAEEQTLNAADRIVYALKDGPAYPDEIMDVTGLAQGTVKVTLSGLRKAGKVEPTGESGKWGAEQVRLSLASYEANDNDNDPGDPVSGVRAQGNDPSDAAGPVPGESDGDLYVEHADGRKVSARMREYGTEHKVHDSKAEPGNAPTSAPLVNGIYHHGPECPCWLCEDVG